MNRFFGLVILFLIVFSSVKGQNTRSVESPTPPRPTYQASKKVKKKGIFAKKKVKGDSEIVEFRDRLQKVYKQKAKEEKLANKPRYKDPTYFGHKKKPKKRPPGKQKFCKICKIKH